MKYKTFKLKSEIPLYEIGVAYMYIVLYFQSIDNVFCFFRVCICFNCYCLYFI